MDPAWPSGATYTVRLGLHTGQLLLGSLGEDQRLTYTAVGDTTQHAAWLAQQAAPGTILVSDVTARLVYGEVRLEGVRTPPLPRADRSTCGLPGARARLPSCSPADRRDAAAESLCWAGAGTGDPAGPARAGRRGPGAGGGHRRRARDGQDPAARGVAAASGGHAGDRAGRAVLSYGQATPYGPIRDLLRRACGCTETDSPAIMTANVQQHLPGDGPRIPPRRHRSSCTCSTYPAARPRSGAHAPGTPHRRPLPPCTRCCGMRVSGSRSW